MSSKHRSQEMLPRETGFIRAITMEATQRLLGDTIAISDLDWQRPSLLPGWTRAHIATHLAQNASGLAKTIQALKEQRKEWVYPPDRDRLDTLERGSERDALQLQIDLDTSAGELSLAFDQSTEIPADRMICVSSDRQFRFDLVPLARLNEVVLHHVDLDLGYRVSHIDGVIARMLLAWNSYWIADCSDYPAVEITSESGFQARLGPPGSPLKVNGPDNLLLGWLTGRSTADQFSAADLPTLPLSH